MNIGFQTSDLSGFTRVAYLWRRHASAVLWIAMAALLPTACSDDAEQPVPQANGHTAVIYLNFKTGASKQAAEMNASQSSETRAPLTRAIDENSINTVDVLSFKVDPADPTNIKKGTFFYRAQGTYDTGTQTVRVQLMGASEHQTLVVLANVREQVNTLGAAFGEQKEGVMNRLTFDVGTDAAPDFTNGIPMWGELPNQAVGEGFSPSGTPQEVTMIRAVAKFTLINPLESDLKGFFYYYNDLRLYNYRAKGRIAPDNYNVTGKQVNTPTVPVGARQTRGTFALLNSDVSPGNIGIFNGSQKTFYLCEVDNKNRPSGGNALDDLCLVMHVKPYLTGSKPSVDGYYRLDFKDYGSGVPMDILRNHEYKVQVESVDGLPAQTPEEAFKGNYTLKCKIVPWNEVQEEVIVEGNKRLKVDKREFVFPGDPNVTGETGGSQLLTLSTENTGGWRIEGKPDWISLSQTTGGDNTSATVTLTVSEVNPGRTDRTATMNLIAGSLTYKIHLLQPDACGRNGTPKKMRLGNNDYYTHRFNEVCWMLENSREGNPDNTLPPLPGQTAQRYLWNGFEFFKPEKNHCPPGWRIPVYTDILHLGRTMHDNVIERDLWLHWQQPGVLAYYPTFDAHGEVVGPWPGRESKRFWQNNMPVWETRQLPRMVSYTWKQQDNISAFWTHQMITDVSMHSGIQDIPAVSAMGHAYMARIPVATQPLPSYEYYSCLSLASVIKEPDLRGQNVWIRARNLLQNYETVNKQTGEQLPMRNLGTNLSWLGPRGEEIAIRAKISSGSFFGAPYNDMPWHLAAGNSFYIAAINGSQTFPYVNVLSSNGTDARYNYYITKENRGVRERNFYPGVSELIREYPYHMDKPYFRSYNFDVSNQQGLGAYLENSLPIRFVRTD